VEKLGLLVTCRQNFGHFGHFLGKKDFYYFIGSSPIAHRSKNGENCNPLKLNMIRYHCTEICGSTTLLENTFDQKDISANPSPKPNPIPTNSNSYTNPNPKTQ